MTSKATTVLQYLTELPEDRQVPVDNMHKTILKNLPAGFEACISYGMIGYVVPHTLYPAGYHCDPKLPLPFIALGSQKNSVNLYHMGIYANPKLLEWFSSSYAALNIGKLDMGKSCIRFSKMDKIPYDLIGELSTKMTPAAWIEKYESLYNK
jgi:Domain of unknown function (DU1801)